MAIHLSEEEQIEALKRWWDENGNSLIFGVIIVFAVYFGARQWQSSQTANAATASDLYQAISDLVVPATDGGLTGDQLALIENDYDLLRNEYANSIYTRYAALMMARVYVQQDNYDQAAAELNWVLENPDLGLMKNADDELFLTTRLRLARVRLAQGQAQEALDLTTEVEPGALAAAYAEVQGDAYSQLGQAEQARGAYERALALMPSDANLIQMKMQGLGGQVD